MKILFFIPAWRRRRITAACYAGLNRFIADKPEWMRATCRVLIVASEDEDESLAYLSGFDAVRIPNHPLGQKFNAGMEHALERYDFDYCFQINSDNLLDSQLWQAFAGYFDERAPFFGLERLYFYDSCMGGMKQYRYFDGCGIRVIRRDVIERAGWCKYGRAMKGGSGMWMQIKAGQTGYFPEGKYDSPRFQALSEHRVFHLWPKEAARGLDNKSRDLMFWANGLATLLFPNPEQYHLPLAVDIKSDTNIWPYDAFDAEEVDANEHAIAMRRFPELRLIQGA